MKDLIVSPGMKGCYVNRELSWLQFNSRVLEEAEDPANPLCERLNFVSIFQSNLDEFYMVRVGMLMDTLHLTATDDKTGMTSAEQTAAVLEQTRQLLSEKDRICKSLMVELKDQGVERISSQDLSSLMKVTASQIRQDFNNFGGFGQQGYGYNVEYLYNEIGKILGLDQQHNFIIVGAGNLGRALGNYMNFERRGFIFKGMFDQNPELVGRDVRGVRVLPMESLEHFIREHEIEIAVLTIPKTSAEDVAEQLVKYGIKGIWNFAHVDLNVPEGVQVENVHLSDSLMKLSYNINRYRIEQG